ncbi:hypothetical protein SELMODRAFT_271086 [Selaginella moellendorffii]|uniref:TsaA-like domain-containing protein n=1 Tax=Selaginella moellendorffii TaxID=88036 RepID=D8RUM5_SELML|nr:hypothetical protein SELMODRAFT_271086 [Selaginella moellendorffii]
MMRWAIAVVSVSTATALLIQVWRLKRKCVKLELKLVESDDALQISQKQRAEERTGRIRAQRDLRKNLMQCNVIGKTPTSSFPMTPIGYMRSCYSTRNGTPRQPLLVTLAKSRLVLSSGVPAAALDGIEQYSHCWLIYVFHENTDLHNLWELSSHRDFKAKVRVPRLNGAKLGVFATRTPHRPCPIGLTVAKVERLEHGILMLSGADLVDGTPVIDIKPYLPYCDSVREASAPTWVNAGGEDDPLAVASVTFTEASLNGLDECWNKMERFSLYSSSRELHDFIAQVLSRDIRSLSQRQRPHDGVVSEIAQPLYGDSSELHNGGGDEKLVLYNVILEGLKISYTVDADCKVVVRSVQASSHLLENPLWPAAKST